MGRAAGARAGSAGADARVAVGARTVGHAVHTPADARPAVSVRRGAAAAAPAKPITLEDAAHGRGAPPELLMRRTLPILRVTTAAALLPGAAFLVHLKLLRSEPGADAVLDRAPSVVRLWFSQRAEVAVTRVRVVGPAGPVALGAVQRADAVEAAAGQVSRPPVRPAGGNATVAIPVRGAMPPGTYTVEWRTMAADGHPVSGRYTFRVAATTR